MKRARAHWVAWTLTAFLLLLAGPPVFTQPSAPGVAVNLRLDEPTDGTQVAEPLVIVAGAAQVEGFTPPFEVAIIIDTSGSTADAAGGDVNGDGAVDAADNILLAEITAAQRLLDEMEVLEALDPTDQVLQAAVCCF